MPEKIDLAVIGGGSGGVRAARKAAAQGADVVLFEQHRLGGTCVNAGCVPKKLLWYAAHFRDDFEAASAYGWDLAATPTLDWPRLRAAKEQEISRLNGVYQRILLEAGVNVVAARAQITAANRVETATGSYEAATILVATGSKPQLPELDGMRDLAQVSDDIFVLEQLPKQALVLGAGYIAVEFACILAGLGANTTLLHRGPVLLKNFDAAVQRALHAELSRRGIRLRLTTQLQRLERRNDSVAAVLAGGETIEADLVLGATGRRPHVAGLGLEAAGVTLGAKGEIVVSEDYRSNIASVFALGDVIGRVPLTPVAIAEAERFVAQRFGGHAPPVDYRLIPTAVFSNPQVGSIGLTEEQAQHRHGNCEIYERNFIPMKQILPGNQEKTLVKMIFAPNGGRLLGAHMVGAEAGEIMQGLAVALTRGATKRDLAATVGIHPTVAEEFVALP